MKRVHLYGTPTMRRFLCEYGLKGGLYMKITIRKMYYEDTKQVQSIAKTTECDIRWHNSLRSTKLTS